MQQPTATPSRQQEIKLIKNIPNLSIKQINTNEVLSPSTSKDMGSPTDLDSPTRRKKMLSLKKAADVEMARTQLNNYIDILDTKVYKLVEKHQAEFLVAYRNHIKKVREEMEEIRNKALSNANSTVSQTEKIEALEKQLTIFREESLKLFEKVNEKEGTIYNLKLKISELETERAYQQKSIRELMRRNKQLEGLHYESEAKKSIIESNINEKQFFISRPQQQQFQQFKNLYNLDIKKAGTTFTRSRPYTTAINSKGASIRSRNHSVQINNLNKIDYGGQIEQVEAKIEQILKGEANEKVIKNLKEKVTEIMRANDLGEKSRIGDFGTTMIGREGFAKRELKKNSKSFIDSKSHARTSELQEYFCKSIETVRKQITRRRGLKSMNFYSEYANLSLAQFKKVDFFRLLQLLLSNDKIIATLHRAIFQQSKQYL